jgi:hypothetical protein
MTIEHREPSDRDEALRAVEAMFSELVRHEEHTWEQVGRCVYCVDCDQRLYQGSIPESHTNVKRRQYGPINPKATRDMRERWGMDG